ncbi:hypothetical protein HZZ00_34700 [Streptomyces sp. NEAU-sy36]|uniref:hypothetical protein n=1 Tax=unclassified Streptomyces TaxID=2593676 RepID=UPI0015D58B54|nr:MULTISPECIES: hypothetical protein [unclassified Streptomyces]QLJ05667.1 hypothetical protein HZZ00_34700 [Streptomyces sp. NEAU-sy36]
MPRGRHRHSPPLHRLLPPSAIAGVSVACALGPWVFSEAAVLRVLAGAAAVTALAGAFVMRRWDIHAGKQVADLARARAGDEWRFEERVAELEADLEESRELRTKLEQRLRAKRAELAGLRNEHAALLRRYATAETERASALEGRRLLEIESGTPALPSAARPAASLPSASPALPPARSAEPSAAGVPEKTYDVFSAEGAKLYGQALRALAAFDRERGSGSGTRGEGPAAAKGDDAAGDIAAPDGAPAPSEDAGPAEARPAATAPQAPAATGAQDETSEPAGTPEPVDAAGTPADGHFTVPTAVAVVPAPPVRRPTTSGGFDFFGTQKGAGPQKAAPKPALDAVQNEDLADVVGQEALAVHKAEEEAGFKPAGDDAHGVGQVIDLTAHDETEQIDVQGLRSAAS